MRRPAAFLIGLLSLTGTGLAEPDAPSRPADVPVVDLASRIVPGPSGTVSIPGLPLGDGVTADLELEPFTVIGPETRFVVGRRGGADRALPFDPSSITFYRGSVAGRPGSHVFLALGAHHRTGAVDLGASGGRYLISGRDADGAALAPGRASVFPAAAASARPPNVPACGVDDGRLVGFGGPELDAEVAVGLATTSNGARLIEVAVETDHEFFQLFGDLDAASAYVTALYAQISDIYLRDVNTRLQLSFVRLWDDPDDLFNDVDPTPLPEFRDYWNLNMGGVVRDTAQLISGRRDYPFGGQAYLSALCGPSSYSVVGYMLGFYPDPSGPSPYHYDISVCAHELGHVFGTGHTHSSPNNLDTCQDPFSTPQRGSIMSYCGQTWSGGNANRDLRFHTVIQQNMLAHISASECVPFDCNFNGIDDADDISAGTSLDVNGNQVPDECEDCNDNGTLDPIDIMFGLSGDANGNALPDECEADCNGNGIPDDLDIGDGTSDDVGGNGVPDECEADCDGNGVADYTDIQLDITLDIDRDVVLDACRDCDGDGTPDVRDVGGAHNVWMASGLPGSRVGEFYATTGVLVRQSANTPMALVAEGQDVIATDDGRVLVSSAMDHRVLQFDLEGQYLGDLVTSGAGGLAYPTGMLMNADGTLLVCSRDTNSVLAYDGQGAPLGAFVAAGADGLLGPFGITRGPNGNLFVTAMKGAIHEFDGATGAVVGTFVDVADNGGLSEPRGLTFKRDGNLLVCSYGTNEVLEYDGTTGASLGKWARSGTPTSLTQTSPWGIRVGPNGNVYLARTGEDFGSGGGGDHDHDHDHDDGEGDIYDGGDDDDGDSAGLHLTDARIYEFDISNGNFIRSYIGGNDHGFAFATGFDFVPGHVTDCNFNQLADDCDIASGASADADMNGVPDECEVDCNGNGICDRLDIIPFGTSLDVDGNGLPDECDLIAACAADTDGSGTVDIDDVINVILDFGTDGTAHNGDVDGSGFVDIDDVVLTVLSFGPCPMP